MSEKLPQPNDDTLQKLGELMLSLRIPGKAVYIDIYPTNPRQPEDYTYEYWEADCE